MDVLIVERGELVAALLADALNEEGIMAAVASDDEVLQLRPDDTPRVVITGINRGHSEDMIGLEVVAGMRRKWSQLGALYLAALWPLRLRHEMLAYRDRFLTKPVCLTQLIRTLRELLGARRPPWAS
jgi:DNA-binding response OmpR family regulator